MAGTRTKKGQQLKGGKQEFLPGQEPKRYPAIEAKIVEYDKVKRKRVELTNQEDSLAKELGKMMREREISVYTVDEIEAFMPEADDEVKAKTRKAKAPKADKASKKKGSHPDDSE